MKKKKEKISKTDRAKRIDEYVQNWASDTSLNCDQPDYTKQIKDMVHKMLIDRENSIKNYVTKKTIEHSNMSIGEVSKTDNIYNKRREKALLNYLPIISKQYKTKYPNIAIERCIMHISTCMTDTYPDSAFVKDGKHTSDSIAMPIAVFILDALNKNDMLEEALNYLPDGEDILNDSDIPDDSDSVHTDNTIKRMMYLIKHRDDNNERHAFYNHTSATRVKTTQNNKNITTNRARMDKILSMMPKEIIENAQNKFKTKFFEYLEIFFKTCSEPWETITTTNIQISDTIKSIDDVTNKARQIRQKTETTFKKTIKDQIQKNKNILTLKSSSFDLNNIENIAHTIYDDNKRLYDLEDKHDELLNQIDSLTKTNKDAYTLYNNTIWTLLNSHDYNYKSDIQAINNEMHKFDIENPYEIIFGFFSLLDDNDDLPWLIELSCGLLDIAISYLPFLTPACTRLRKKIRETEYDTIIDITECKDDEYKDYSNLNNQLYKKRYTNFITHKIFKDDDVTEDELININTPQLISQICDIAIPRDMTFTNSKLVRILMKTGMSKKCAQMFSLLAETIKRLRIRNKKAIEEIKAQYGNNTTTELQNTIEKQAQQISELKTAAYNTKKELQNAQKETQSIKDNTKLEHDELIQLRELIYTLQNSNTETEITLDNNIQLPYTSKQKIIIYGGHESWRNSIKSLLLNVRFIEPNEKPNSNTIRNADIIWMQTNAMPHDNYYKIMDIARQYKIPVKYFKYASAEKCAYQFANDMESKITNDI